MMRSPSFPFEVGLSFVMNSREKAGGLRVIYWVTARTLKNLFVADDAPYVPGLAAVQFTKSGLDSSII
jgi:hypothetical protein